MGKHSNLLNCPVIIMLNPALGGWFDASTGSAQASLTTWFFLVEPCFHAVSGQAGVVSPFGDFAIWRTKTACSTIERLHGVTVAVGVA
jgi:hypothetical protein